MDVRQCFEDLKRTVIIKCRLCSKVLNKPRTLPCLHSFCLACLDNLAHSERRRHQEEISCPTCQASFPIPEENTFNDLPTSFLLERSKDIQALANRNQGIEKCSSCTGEKDAISFCYVCRDYLCLCCDLAHQRLRATRGHHNILLQNVQTLLQRPAMCSQEYHEDLPLSRYCQQCHECVCQVCHDVRHSFWRHDVVNIEQAAEQGKLQINEALVKAEQEIAALKDEIKENSEIFVKRKEDIDAARRNVEAFVNVSIQSLKKHEKDVLKELDGIYAELQQGHATKQGELEFIVTQLRSPLEHGKCVLKRNFDVEIVKEQEAVINRCEDLLSSKQNWESSQLPFVKYIADEEMFKSVRVSGPGRVIVSSTDPSRSTAHGVGLRDPLVDRNTSFEVVTRDSRGKQRYHENDQVKVRIQNPMGDEMQSTLTDNKDGKYIVSFTPECVSQHDVMIAVNGQPLTDSPWSVQVMAPHQYQRAFELGSKGYGDGQFSSPCGIAICKNSGEMAVADYFGNRVTLFSPKGIYLRHFGDKRDSTKNLKRPYSVAFSASGEIIVVDSGDKLMFCSSEGLFMRYIEKWNAALPESVSVSSNGQLIVCDKSDAKIKVLSPNGIVFVKSFSSDQKLDGKPSFAIHYGDKFFVSYPKKHCVKVFGGDGDFLYDIGAVGCDQEKLDTPLGLAIDRFNNLVVCDSNISRLQVYKLDGRHVATIEGQSSELASPQFVAASKDGHLFVTDSKNYSFGIDKGKDCVHVFY